MHQKRTISFTIREQMHQKILSNFDASQCINFKKCINEHLRHHFASQASNCYGIIDAGATRKASIHLIVRGRGLAVTLFRRMILETANCRFLRCCEQHKSIVLLMSQRIFGTTKISEAREDATHHPFDRRLLLSVSRLRRFPAGVHLGLLAPHIKIDALMPI